jgi:D-aminoacyl-tRNA deacylase
MVNFAVVYSKKDEAGKNIARHLKEYFLPQVPIIEARKDIINLERIDEQEEKLRNSEFIVFASRHASKSGNRTLSVHAPGNWGKNEFGGRMGKVCKSSALIQKFLFQKLNENAKKSNSDYEITLEATHHGPFITKPCCFIEIGSSEEQWKDEKAGKIIAETISQLQEFKPDKDNLVVIGIGGPHYCPNFNKIQVSEESIIAISHIIPKYALPLTEKMILEAVEKTQEDVKLILVDWEGMGNSEERQKSIAIIERLGIDYERVDKIEK